MQPGLRDRGEVEVLVEVVGGDEDAVDGDLLFGREFTGSDEGVSLLDSQRAELSDRLKDGRGDLYKRFAAARTEEEVAAHADEMKDRFGPPDKAGEVFVLVERIRTLGSLCGFENIYEEGELIYLKAGECFRVPIQHMIEILKKNLGFFVRDGKNNVLYFKASSPAQIATSKQPVSHDAILQSLLVAMRALTAPLQKQMAEKAG